MSRIHLMAAALCLLASCDKPGLFRELKQEKTGITFSNTIREDGMINMLTYEYLYNGGGVGIVDFNNVVSKKAGITWEGFGLGGRCSTSTTTDGRTSS